MSAAEKREGKLHEAYLGLGSNIAPENNLPEALRLLKVHGEVTSVSRVWRSPPVGAPGPYFLNAAARYLTPHDQQTLKLEVVRGIEEQLRRTRTGDPNAPRTIDVDILIFDGEIIDPHIWKEAHIAVPLAEIHPQIRPPGSRKPLDAIAVELRQEAPIAVYTKALAGFPDPG